MDKKLKKLTILFLLPAITGLSFAAFATTWAEEIERSKSFIDEKTHKLIIQQYTAYKEKRLPAIADEEIKGIPIKESGEKLIDIKALQNESRIQILPDPDKPFGSTDCNSGFKAASKMREGLYNKLNKMILDLDELAPHFGYKPGSISIKVFEGLRGLETQKMLFENKEKEVQSENPFMSKDDVFNEASKWVSPIKNNVPVHSTGGAIDIRLFDEEKRSFINMGLFGVIWGQNKTAPTFSEELSHEQMANRLFLLMTATQNGLINYPYEYWHYSSGDRYAAVWLEPNVFARQAIYGSIKE